MGKKIVHVEFPAQDLDRAEKFWEAVGGWSIEGMGMPGIDYRMYQEGDQGGGVYAGDGARSSTTEARTSTPT
jgi:predicted enzyme related to lactoylglutathione lyase